MADNRKKPNKHAARLTEEQVVNIFLARGLQRDIAAAYGVKQSAVSDIKRRRRWRDVTRPYKAQPYATQFSRKLDHADVRAIFMADGTQSSIAQRFNVTQGLVSKIRSGRVWPTVTAGLRR